MHPGRPADRMRETYARGQALMAGETVTCGEFTCKACGFEHEVEKGKVTNLPVCPRCQNDTWDLA